MTRNSDQTGRLAESYACARLMLKGYWPVASRFKTPVGEIDLIMRRGSKLVFVEVKYRNNLESGLYALQPKQAGRLQKAAAYYLAGCPIRPHITLQFDLVAVTPRGGFHHLDNILSQTA